MQQFKQKEFGGHGEVCELGISALVARKIAALGQILLFCYDDDRAVDRSYSAVDGGLRQQSDIDDGVLTEDEVDVACVGVLLPSALIYFDPILLHSGTSFGDVEVLLDGFDKVAILIWQPDELARRQLCAVGKQNGDAIVVGAASLEISPFPTKSLVRVEFRGLAVDRAVCGRMTLLANTRPSSITDNAASLTLLVFHSRGFVLGSDCEWHSVLFWSLFWVSEGNTTS